MLYSDFAFEEKTYVEAAIFYYTSIVTEKKYTEIKKVALKLMTLEHCHAYKMPVKTMASKGRVGHSRTLKYSCTKPSI